MARKRIPKKVIESIQEYIGSLRSDAVSIDRVLLFGSYAKGTQHPWSDVDLCVISPKFRNTYQATQYLWSKRLHDSGLTIEPIGFTKESFRENSSLVSEIKKFGIDIPIQKKS